MAKVVYPRDENEVPCTCSENRAEGDPEYHEDTCPWAIVQKDEEEKNAASKINPRKTRQEKYGDV